MPDKKITDLVDGTPLQPTDEFVVARAGDNFKIDGADIVSAATAAVTKHDVTLSGNTAGVLADISSGTWTLAGGNNITLSQVGNAVTISGANVGGAQTGISGIANSEDTYTSGTVSLSELGALTIRTSVGQIFQFEVPATSSLSATGAVSISTNGSTISIGAATQSVQPETQTFIAGISASDTLYTSGNVRITGVGGGVTVSSNTGQRVDISVAAQSVQPETQTFIAGISASDTLYTSGNVRITGVGGGITVSSNTGQRIDLSVAAQSVQPETQTFIAGISASDTLYTSGNVRFTGSQAVTVRSGTGQLVVIDVPAQTVQPDTYLSIGVSTGGNTSGNTTVNTGSRFVIVGSNGITASQGTAAGATTVTLSGITQSVQTNDIPRMGVSTGGNTAGDTTVNSGTRFVLVGTGPVSLSQATAASATTVSINAPATSSLSATGIVSLSTNGSTISVGAPAYSGGMSTMGNTSGNTGYASQRLNLVGGNNITLSGSTNGGSMSITISAPNLGAGAMSAGVSNLGNSAGSTGITGTQLVLVGSNNITLSQSTGANGGTLSIIGGGGGGFSAGVSTGGNTAGATGITGTQLVLVGGSNISLSQTTGANGGTVTFNAPVSSSLSATGEVSISVNGSTISIGVPTVYISNWPAQGVLSNTVAPGALFGTAATRTTMSANVWPIPLEAALSVNKILIPGAVSATTATTTANWSFTLGQSLGLYSMNAGTLSLVSSFSHQQRISYASTNNSTNASATWQMSYGAGTDVSSSASLSTNNAGATNLWSSVTNLKAYPFAKGAFSISRGQYVGVWAFSSSTGGANLAVFNQMGYISAGGLLIGEVGLNVASTTANSYLQGRASLTQTNTALPVTFLSADMTTASNNASFLNRPMAVTFLSQP